MQDRSSRVTGPRRALAGLTAITAIGALVAFGASAAVARAQEGDVTEERKAAEALARADEVFRARKYEEALELYRGAAEAAAAEPSVRAEALAQVARMHALAKRMDEGRRWLEQAKQVASPEHPLGWTRYLGVRGIFEREAGERERALATFVEMHDYALAKALPRRAVDAAHHAAIVASPDEQVAWAKKGIAAAETLGDKGWLAVLWNNLGATCEDRGDWKAAANAYAKAREYHHAVGSDHQKLVADWALGRAALRAGDLAQAAVLLPDVLARARARHEAIEDAAEAGAEGGAGEAREWLGWGLAAHGELLAAQGQAPAGVAQMREGRALLVAAGIEEWWPAALADLDARIAAAQR